MRVRAAVHRSLRPVCFRRYKFHRKDHLAPREEPWPGVTILKPLIGGDSLLATNLESFFTMNYPTVSDRHGWGDYGWVCDKSAA